MELESLIQEKNDTKEILTNFITKLEDLTGEQTEFREELWGGLVDHIRIDEKSSTVVFRGGIEILFNIKHFWLWWPCVITVIRVFF